VFTRYYGCVHRRRIVGIPKDAIAARGIGHSKPPCRWHTTFTTRIVSIISPFWHEPVRSVHATGIFAIFASGGMVILLKVFQKGNEYINIYLDETIC
jgi:hypothetical protein